MDSYLLDWYNTRFSKSIIGKWITVEGSFNMQMDCFEFLEGGIGFWFSKGLNYDERLTFEWRKCSDFCIEMKFEDDDLWQKINYRFKLISNDFGSQIILCQNQSDTFYLATTKIGYSM